MLVCLFVRVESSDNYEDDDYSDYSDSILIYWKDVAIINEENQQESGS